MRNAPHTYGRRRNRNHEILWLVTSEWVLRRSSPKRLERNWMFLRHRLMQQMSKSGKLFFIDFSHFICTRTDVTLITVLKWTAISYLLQSLSNWMTKSSLFSCDRRCVHFSNFDYSLCPTYRKKSRSNGERLSFYWLAFWSIVDLWCGIHGLLRLTLQST